MSLTRREFALGSAAFAIGGCLGARGRTTRDVTSVVEGVRSRDGAGVNLRRMLGHPTLSTLDPFVLLDEIHSSDPADYVAGFPDHPHRGFETVSILLLGAFDHRDSVGNHGHIADGGAQWMTAGHGIVHSEMPRQTGGDELWGLQLWVNLPARLKMTRPRYQDLTAADVPLVPAGDARARVIAGRVNGRRGPVDGIFVDPTLLDVTVPPGARFDCALPGAHTAFLHVLSGEVAIGRNTVGPSHLALLGPGDRFAASSPSGGGGGRFLLFAGAPIGEPIARRGPFVMNTESELDQAFADYRSGRLTEMAAAAEAR
jgi:redox-sensitive bicupin YhaK (pirin superfamily)